MSRDSRPNIVLIMSDQHNKHIAGCYGDPVVRTPNLDRLAERGVRFSNAYCPFPLCSPARMSFLTGRAPHELGVWDNSTALGSDVPTFAHALGQAGYEVVLCGRMHFNGPDQRHGFQARVFPEVSGNAAGQLVGTNGFRRPSFEISGPGQNHYLLYDEQCTEAANQWLAAHANPERPFCLIVGWVGPHCPFVCPRDLYDYYYDAIDVPTYSDEHHARQHPYIRRFRQRSQLDTLTEHEIRRTRAAYYGMIEFDDRLVGAVQDTLERTGLADETALVYTSDHGDMANEHGMWWKMSFYEGSAGVPMIASLPGRWREGACEPGAVSLADWAPTLAQIGDAPEIPGCSARGLLDALTSEGALPDDRAVFSEMWSDPIWRESGASGGPSRMLRQGPWKASYYHNERAELFNLADDPDEMRDRSDDPACKEVLDRMLAELLRDWDPEAVDRAAHAKRTQREFARSSPQDRAMLQGEYWVGPDGYGRVEPT